MWFEIDSEDAHRYTEGRNKDTLHGARGHSKRSNR